MASKVSRIGTDKIINGIKMDMLTYVKESTDEKIAEEKKLQPAVGISAIQVGIKKKLLAIVLKNDKDLKMLMYLYLKKIKIY